MYLQVVFGMDICWEMNAVLCVCMLAGQVFHEKVLLNDFNMENMHVV